MTVRVVGLAAAGIAAMLAATAALAAGPRPARILLFPTLRQALQTGVHLDTESVSNVAGGLRRATAFDTLLHAGINLDSGALGLWQGGKLRLSAVRINSGQPDTYNIGDLQVTSNIAAPNATRVYQFWYRQRLSRRVAVRAGLIDMNQYFAVTPHAGTFLNASFGILPTISVNVPSSIYPTPGAGIIVSGRVAGWQAEAGAFQGEPSHRGEPFQHGAMAIGQVQRGPLQAGLWNYRETGSTARNDWGAYGSFSGTLARGVSGFVQFGATPRSGNQVPYYLGAGLMARSPLFDRPGDRLGLAVARAWIRGAPKAAETIWEFTCVVPLSRHFYLQPDVQYVVDPSASSSIANATVVFMRVHMEFDS
ncbi:MAG: carbohydrate porin [Gammaproteobacteria bacterium]